MLVGPEAPLVMERGKDVFSQRTKCYSSILPLVESQLMAKF